MCGIVGYTGQADVGEILVSGLRRLEYRGYDSAGVALYAEGEPELTTVKASGKIANLEASMQAELPETKSFSAMGIGHTRWATHGAPTQANAHPHWSENKEIAVVHNGIIENYAELKAHLIEKGCTFNSETDSEVIAHLVQQCYQGDLLAAVTAAIKRLTGTYGIAVISTQHPGTIVAARSGSPIVVGLADDETIIASDVSAIVSRTKQVVFLNDGDIVTATGGDVNISSTSSTSVSRESTLIDWDVDEIEKGGYDHFMLKEIHEQPSAIATGLRGRLDETEGTVRLGGLRMSPLDMARVPRIILAACGTSYYAGMVGKYYFEDFANIPADIQQAAEFRYRNPIIEPNTCMVAISQSGETADTLAAVREGLMKGAVVLGVCNVVGSTIARETGRGTYLHAGPEIGVASTKAFTSQVTVLAEMAIMFGRTRRLSAGAGREMVRELARLPDIAAAVLERESEIKAIAEKYAAAEDAFFIGRGYMFPAALEGALKLKEISYMHAEGYHAAELKHGPIALLDEKVPVIVPVPDLPDKEKTIGNMQECRARKSPVIAIATEGDNDIEAYCDDVIWVPRCQEFIAPVPVVIAEQIFAYYVAKARGCEIDQPRNLAKSVTVE
jgi:glucosamine--fructose-6-phosphate aminotransferase (isomerizing)